MHFRFLSWLLACAFFAAISLHAQPPAATPAPPANVAQIRVAKVTGTVQMTVNGATTELHANDAVPQAASINTLNDSSVILAFSNGATTQLGANTELVVAEFLQDPFASQVSLATMTEEPSVSHTRLQLHRGELVGKVAHLRHNQGSTFVVETPVGAAGIRGTTFRIVFTPNGTGQAFFQLSTVEGNVSFSQGSTGGNNTPGTGGNTGGGNNSNNNGGGGGGGGGTTPAVTGSGTADVPVPQGQQIEVTVNVTTTPTGGTVVTVTTPLGTQTLPPALAAQVTQVTQEIAVATQQTVFTPTPPASSTTTGSTGQGNSGNSSDNSNSKSGTDNSGTNNSNSNNQSQTQEISGNGFSGTVTTPPQTLTPGAGR